jgi:hypothetical protein
MLTSHLEPGLTAVSNHTVARISLRARVVGTLL